MAYINKFLGYFIAIFILGFICFWGFLPHGFSAIPPKVQGIAVFTGGAGRVETALNLLEKNSNIPILITGVHPMVNLAQLLHGRKINPDAIMNLTLDHTALTTRQNVEAVKKWAQLNGITKVGLLTSNYHMLRSRIMFYLYAPKLQIFPMPIEKSTSLSFLFREYAKLLLTPLLK